MEKQTRLMIMIGLAFLFFVIEIISGYYTGSVALIADSFHMLSDVAALFIALYASKLAKSKNAGIEFSYGLQRAEVVGALINGISLLALSFTLVIEAIQRFFKPEHISNPWMVLYVGTAGLTVNIAGIFLFHDHSHAHHVPLPSSEESNVNVTQEIENPIQLPVRVMRVAEMMHQKEDAGSVDSEELASTSSRKHHDHHHHDHAGHSHSDLEEGHNHGNHAGHSHHDMNMRGVFLHILGDLLASIGVIASTLVFIFVDGSWTVYLDPLTSLFITSIIIFSTIPLVKSACYILLQRTPSSVSVESLRRDILTIPGVLGVHELHVWQLSEAQTIASVHVVVPRPDNDKTGIIMEERYMKLASEIKIHGVHSTTVQPEFIAEKSPILEFEGEVEVLSC